MTQSLRSSDDFERHARATEGTLGGYPQVVRHSLQKFESSLALGGKLGDRIAQRKKRANCNDHCAKGLQIGEGSPHSRASIDNIIHYRDALTFDGRMQRYRETVLDRI